MQWLLLSTWLLLGFCGISEARTTGVLVTNGEDVSPHDIRDKERKGGGEEEKEGGEEGEQGKLWAVLVAGSNSWYNYRHQADICHAYQILHQHGVPDDNIIVMMYDDIAHNNQNPTPGVIFNRPDGPNVYEGVLKDYTGEDVTPENFLNILSGNASAMTGIGSGKVVRSNNNDRIFINLVDHGAPGIFGFPDQYLHARALINTIIDLHRDASFKEMVIYLESCESGSIFKNLIPDDVNVYALSASGPHQPSYACYMDKEIGAFVGDVFSVKWMEDTDVEDIHHETLKHQYHLVKREVTTSKVMQWGQRNISKKTLWEFMGKKHNHMMNKDDQMLNKLDLVVNKDDQVINKDKQMMNRDEQMLNKLDLVVNKDYQMMNKNKQMMNKNKQMMNKDKQMLNKLDLVVNKEDRTMNKDDNTMNNIYYYEVGAAPDKFHKNTSESIIFQDVYSNQTDNSIEESSGDGDVSQFEVDTDYTLDIEDRYDPCINSSVANPDVPIAILKSRIQRSTEDKKEYWRQELTTLHMLRLMVHVITRTLVNEITESNEEAMQAIIDGTVEITQWECYERSVDIFHNMCFNLGKNPYALRVMQILVNLCEHGYTPEKFLEAATNNCNHTEFVGIH